MKILIKQDRISLFGRFYTVYKDNKKLYSIWRVWLNPIPKYIITEYPTENKIGSIRGKFFSLRANATISIPSGDYQFEQKKLTVMQYFCKSINEGSDLYKLAGTKGLGGSIYKNEKQIGKWDKNRFVILDGDVYEVDLNDDVDILLIFSMMVLVDTYRLSITVGGDLIGWEVGNISKGLQHTRDKWSPKQNEGK